METVHKAPNYMAIFYWLFALTVIEVIVAYLPVARVLMVASLVGLAVAKAALVAMYFMHLKFERPTLSLIAITPAVLLVLFVLITYPDTAWKAVAP